MSIMSQLADEVLKPVKKGVYIAAAALTIGGLAIAANSKTGRKIGKGVANAVQGKSPEEIQAEKEKEKKEKEDKAKLAKDKEESKAIELEKPEVKRKENQGAQNA